jgi:large subunit ribosomal protein L32
MSPRDSFLSCTPFSDILKSLATAMALALSRSSFSPIKNIFSDLNFLPLRAWLSPFGHQQNVQTVPTAPTSACTHHTANASAEIRQSLLGSLLEIFPPFLLAVPKKKVSHSRKAMRAANKGLKDKQNIVNCPACGSPKLAHHLCANCYTFLNRQWKQSAKGRDSVPDLP